MPPLNTCEERVDSYYSTSNQNSRANSPFDDEDEDEFLEEDLEEAIKSEQEEASGDSKPDRSLFLNFNADLNPQNTTKKPKPKKATTYKVNGVNILNRKSLDSKTVMERLKRRRENHNSVERKRRDNINHTILEISQLIPHETTSTKLNKGSILRLAADYIKEIQIENKRLIAQLERYKTDVRVQPSEERVGYPMKPYTQLLHDQPSYPIHPRTRSLHESSHFAPQAPISGYQPHSRTSSIDVSRYYPSSQSPHSNSHSNPAFPSQSLHVQTRSIPHLANQIHTSPQVHPPPTSACLPIQNTSIQENFYPSASLPACNGQQSTISTQLYTSQPTTYRYNAPSSTTAAQHLLPPLYQSTQQQRKGMMFNEFSGTLNLF